MVNGESYLARMNIPAYYPKSIVWLLFPAAPPPAWVIDLVIQTARISTLLAMVGLLTRPSMIVATLSCLFIGALMFSWEPLWSHPYNSGLIAGLAFMFGRAGDTLSIDSLFARHVLRRPISLNRDVYWWPVILGQFGVATVYFGGFYAKWSTPAMTFDFSWVFSDNLRNSVALPWLVRGQQFPWNVELIVSNPWIWKLSAFGHLATQALPILALASLNRPWIRLLEGSVFAAGVVLLKLIMGMWNPSWIILTAFFVDWEFFLKKIGFKFSTDGGQKERSALYSRSVIYYCLIMFFVNMIIIIVRFDDRGKSRLYPFSSMNFYSGVMALKPYGEHRHYPFTYGQMEFVQPDSSSRYWYCAPGIAASYLATYATAEDADARAETQAVALRSLLASAARNGDQFSDCEGTVHAGTATVVNLYSSILQIAPYPEPVKFEIGHRALVSRFEKDKGRIIAAASQAVWSGGAVVFNVASRGFGPVKFEILLAGDPWKKRDPGPLTPVPGEWNGNSFRMDPDFYAKLPASTHPIVVRAIEPDGATYDFFGGLLYR